MPGLVFNPISNYGAGRGVQPYVPTYDSVYVSSFDLYQASGSATQATQGGIVKMNFEGAVDTLWMASANSSSFGAVKQVRHSQGARDSIIGDYRVVSSSVDYRETRLIDKTSGAVSASSGLMVDTGGSIFGMVTDENENYIYMFGQTGMIVSGSNSHPALARVPHSSINTDSSFETNLGSGPTNTLGGTSFIHDVYVNKNGKIGVAHNGQTWNNITGKYANFVVLNQDGTVDTTFDFGNSIFEQLGAPVTNGAVLTCHWFEYEGNAVWVVGGIFDSFGGNSTYKKIMAFNEDGTVNSQWTTNFQEGTPGNDLNADVREIAEAKQSGGAPSLAMVMGNFTQKGTSSCKKIMVIQGHDGFPQNLGNGTKPDIHGGVVYNDQLYYVYDGTSVQDNANVTVNVDGMYATDVFSLNHTSPFDIGAGLETSGGASAEPGSIFLG